MRSVDGGREWDNLSHGMYQTDQAVDTHGILASSVTPGLVFSITGAGLFRSPDAGDHWGHVPLTSLDATGRLYTRAIQEDPTDPNVIWVGAGNGFDRQPRRPVQERGRPATTGLPSTWESNHPVPSSASPLTSPTPDAWPVPPIEAMFT